MASVIASFAHVMARTAGLTLSEDGQLRSKSGKLEYVCRPRGGRIADEDYFNLLDWIRSNHDDEIDLIHAYAQTIRMDDIGILGLSIKAAATLRDSLRQIERYFRLVTDSAVYRLEEQGDRATFSIEARTAPHSVIHFRNECALAGFARNIQRLVGDELRFEEVRFQHANTNVSPRYAGLFGCPVKFGQGQDAIVMQRRMLDLPNLLGDSGIFEFLNSHLETEFAAIVEDASLTSSLTNHLSRVLSNGVPSASSAARELGMSERTLYRRLAEEGMTYRDVLCQAQSKLAQSLLKDSDCSIAEIAFMTGFSEQSTFARAFKRWVGQPPAQFRQHALRI